MTKSNKPLLKNKLLTTIDDLNRELSKSIREKQLLKSQLAKSIKKLDEQTRLISNLENQIEIMLVEVTKYKDSSIYKLYSFKCKFITKFKKLLFLAWGKSLLLKLWIGQKLEPRYTLNSCSLITVVMPVYNCTWELKESIESILHQTYLNYELIIVTDGSPTETMKIVNSYKNHPKVRIFHYFKQSGNAVRGRNKGIKEAKGEYIAFQDSDDVADPQRLKLSLTYMHKYKIDVVYGGWRALVDGSRKDIDIKNGQVIYSPQCTLPLMKRSCIPCQSTVMVKRQALLDVGGLNPQIEYHEDHELWLRLLHWGYKFKSIPKILTNLRLHAGNNELNFKQEDKKWHQKALISYLTKKSLPLKIAYLLPDNGVSGGVAVVCEHVNRLLHKGYDPLIIVEGRKTDLSWFPGQAVRVVTIKEADQLENIDILVMTGWSTAYSGQRIKAQRRLYFVQSDERRFSLIDKDFVARVEATYKMDYEFMTEAKWIQKWLKEEFNKEVGYVPNGVNIDIFYSCDPLAPKPKGKFRVLLEGPIDIPYKGMTDSFAAVKDLDCEVWCVSSLGKPKSEWKCDKFLGKVPMEEMRQIYSSCDLILKMSKVEGFFGPPLEMMACGGVPIVAKVSGFDEYIKDGENALVIDSGAIEGANKAISRLAKDKKLFTKLQKGGQETVKQWRWDKSIQMLEEIINNK